MRIKARSLTFDVFHQSILATVILMNACKAASMLWTFWRQREPTLVTIGDAVASYLGTPDKLTEGRCLMAKADVGKGPLRWRLKGQQGPNTQVLPSSFSAPVSRRWFTAASSRRWVVTIGLCVTALATASGLLHLATDHLHGSLFNNQTVFSLGFGKLNPNALIDTSLPTRGSSGLVSLDPPFLDPNHHC